jgi:VWFA-related protein
VSLTVASSGFLREYPVTGAKKRLPLISPRTLFALVLVFFALLRVDSAIGQPQRGAAGGGGRIPGGGSSSRQDPDTIYTGPTEPAGPLKAEVSIVPVRVVVRDSNGHAITNLRKEDFKLSQDGKQQQIANFSVEIATPPAHQTAALESSTMPKPPESPAPGFVAPSRFVAFFFDDANLSMQDLTRSRNAAAHFLDSSLQPSDRVAILTTSGQSQSDFTDDRDKLHATLLKMLPHPVSAGDAASLDCPPMDFFEADAIQNQNDAQALGIATQDALICAFNNQPDFRKEAQDMATRTAAAMMNQADQQTEAVFRRLREIVRRVSVLPGQRSIVMISPGFIYPTHETELAEIMDRAIQLNIVINTLDAKGLYAPDMGDISMAGAPRPAGEQGVLDSLRLLGQNLENNVLVELSDGTGGIAFHDSNDLDAGLREMAAAPEGYYLLGYAPENLKADGHYHSLKVSLTTKQKFTVEARHGFYAPTRNETPAEAVKREIDDAVFSQDEQHGVAVTLQAQNSTTDTAAGNLDVMVVFDVARLAFAKVGGLNQDEITVVTSIFDGDGNYIEGTQKNMALKLRDDTLKQLSRTGATTEVKFNVKPGSYLVRLVVRDSNASALSAENGFVQIPQQTK